MVQVEHFYVLYIKLRKIENNPFRAIYATIFLLDGAGRLAGYVFTGFVSLHLLLMVAVAIHLMVIGMFFGGRIHTNMSQ
jgi:hypothetical protein